MKDRVPEGMETICGRKKEKKETPVRLVVLVDIERAIGGLGGFLGVKRMGANNSPGRLARNSRMASSDEDPSADVSEDRR